MTQVRPLLLSLIFLWLCSPSAVAQKSLSDSSISFTLVTVGYSGMLPGGDMADRFGYTNSIGVEAGLKFENNFYVTGGGHLLFGGKVKEYVASNVTELLGDPSGDFAITVLGNDGLFKEVRFYERGFTFPLIFGKIFPGIISPNPNSGFYVEAGAQFIQHRVRIEVIGEAPQLQGPMLEGYDRLTQGFGIVEGLGYRYYSNNRLLNFQVGLNFSQNFTQGQRDIQFDTGEPYLDNRTDLLFGFKVGWSLLIYQEAPDDAYFY